MEREEYYKKLGWRKSPFIKTTSIDIPIVERRQEYSQIEECIGGWDRIMVVTAPIGYGKTTFMNQLIKNQPKGVKSLVAFNAYEPPEGVMQKINDSMPFYTKIFGIKTDRTTFGEYLGKKLGKNKMLLVFDEAQDYDIELFKWLRMLNDRVDNLFMVFLGLPGLEDKITAEGSFRDRKSKSINLIPFTKEDLKEMIKKRIGWAGGYDIKPFTDSGLERLCTSANSVPRLLLDNGQRVVEECAKRNLLVVDADIVEGVLGTTRPDPQKTIEARQGTPYEQAAYQDFMKELSPTQADIIHLLLETESLSITEISEKLNKDIRSVGSLIRKLRGLNKDEVRRKPNIPYPLVIRAGKDTRLGRLQYVYSLSDNTRRLLNKK